LFFTHNLQTSQLVQPEYLPDLPAVCAHGSVKILAMHKMLKLLTQNYSRLSCY